MGAIFHEKCERFSKQFVFRNVMVKVFGVSIADDVIHVCALTPVARGLISS